MRTIKNKILAVVLLLVGVYSVTIDGDATVLLMLGTLSVCLMFSTENWVD